MKTITQVDANNSSNVQEHPINVCHDLLVRIPDDAQSVFLQINRSGGIGDVTVGVSSWVFRPPTENHGNVSFSAQLKLPTGINDAKGYKINSNGTQTLLPFDRPRPSHRNALQIRVLRVSYRVGFVGCLRPDFAIRKPSNGRRQ